MQIIATCIVTMILFFLNVTVYGSQIFDQTTKNPAIRTAAQEYNKRIPLIALPKEAMLSGMVDPTKPLGQSIKDSLSLSLTCVHFNNLLPYLGLLHKCYPDKEKNKMLRYIKKAIRDEGMSASLMLWGAPTYKVYWQHRRMTLFLIHATRSPEIDGKAESNLCGSACYYHDVEMVRAMLESDVSPSKVIEAVRTKKMALVVDEFCTKRDIDFQKILKDCPFILFSCIFSPDADLVEFYLDKYLGLVENRWLGMNILHRVAHILSHKHSPEDVKIAELLLKKIPDISNMINEKDDRGETPLDFMFSSVEIPLFGKSEIAPPLILIELFRKYGAQRSSELEKDKQSHLIEKSPEKIGWLNTKILFIGIVIVTGLYLWKR